MPAAQAAPRLAAEPAIMAGRDTEIPAQTADGRQRGCGGKSPMSGQTWLDVTTILLWKGRAVGVVRVEGELARWALGQLGDSIGFCRYDGALRTFVSVPREQVAACLALHEQSGATRQESRPPQPPAATPRLRSKARRKRIAKAVRRFARRVSRALMAKASVSAAMQGGDKGRRNGPEQPGSNPEAPMDMCVVQRGDVYVSVGNDWYDKDLGRLEEHKRALGFRVMGICYDLIPIKFPHLTTERIATHFPQHLADLARVCDHVMCISACTRRDFLEHVESLGAPLPETSVIVLGNDLSRKAGGAVPRAAGPEPAVSVEADSVVAIAKAPFVLFVSTIEGRKNHDTLYKAWVCLIESGCSVPDLVCVGMRGWGVADLLERIARDPRVSGRIHLLHGVSDAELAHLYRHCLYTVYPSLYEGWGLPVAESLAFGKFCLCSNAGSLTEAGGQFAEYLDPWDLPAWIERIRFFSQNPAEIEIRNRRAAMHFKARSWSDTSAAIVERARQLVR
jgi:glycosyltransferase involved in cell wall biosynthesis